ncbi:MAG: chromosomal replication initiator protein DnaA [Parachlamydiaceae bacterium]|nr:chromosomal replication initiator protein DnaA [Parachlamydiaceae bacterium]
MEAWENFLKHQEEELGVATVQKWLRPLKLLHFDACNLYLEAKDSFQINWFEEHIRPKILSTLYNNNKKRIKVHLTTSKPSSEKTEQNLSGKGRASNQESTPQQKTELTFDTIDPNFSFENFVEPSSSPLPVRLCSSLDGTPQLTFNPIYIYGDAGAGKTHLLMATALHLQKQGLKVIYARADTFTEHVVSAIRSGEMKDFRQAYRSADVLIVDDVQVFARKAATQEEFFHTFNTLHLSGKQIILAANCAPQGLTNIEARLISRFEWGISIPLGNMSQSELMMMLEKKAKAFHFPLSNVISTFLLETFKSGTKSLTRALQALILRTHLDSTGSHSADTLISLPQAKALLNDLIVEEQKIVLTPVKIIHLVCDHFGIRPEDLLEKSQSRDRVLPRQIAMYFCRKELQMPFLKIAELFSKDHSTVMSSVKLMQKALDNSERDVIDPLESIRKRLRQ